MVGRAAEPTANAATANDVASLTLGDCIRRALARGFDMELQLHDLEIAKDNLPIARSTFHPVVSVGAGKSAAHLPGSLGEPRNRSDAFNTSVGVAQRLWTGTVLGFSSDLNRLSASPTLSDFDPRYTSGLALNLRQPLMRGFGSINTLPIRQAEIGVDIAERSYTDRALDVIQATERAYYLLAGARDQVTVFRISLQLAETSKQLLHGNDHQRPARDSTYFGCG